MDRGRLAILLAVLELCNDRRGGDSWGWSDGHQLRRGNGDISASVRATKLARKNRLIGHTRKATVGAVIPANAHPFSIKGLIGAHNGVVFNKHELDRKYADRTCPVDSMHIFHHIADALPMAEIEAYGAVTWLREGELEEGVRLCRFNGGELSAYRWLDAKDPKTVLGVFWTSDHSHMTKAASLSGMNLEQFEKLGNQEVYRAAPDGFLYITEQKLPISDTSRSTYSYGYGKSYTVKTSGSGSTSGKAPGSPNAGSWKGGSTNGTGSPSTSGTSSTGSTSGTSGTGSSSGTTSSGGSSGTSVGSPSKVSSGATDENTSANEFSGDKWDVEASHPARLCKHCGQYNSNPWLSRDRLLRWVCFKCQFSQDQDPGDVVSMYALEKAEAEVEADGRSLDQLSDDEIDDILRRHAREFLKAKQTTRPVKLTDSGLYVPVATQLALPPADQPRAYHTVPMKDGTQSEWVELESGVWEPRWQYEAREKTKNFRPRMDPPTEQVTQDDDAEATRAAALEDLYEREKMAEEMAEEIGGGYPICGLA